MLCWALLLAADGAAGLRRPPRLQAPAIFAGLWSVVKPFIDPVTRQKIRFVDGPKAVEALDEVGWAEWLQLSPPPCPVGWS